MKLTKRCIQLLMLLAAARWLTTSQVHRRFFKNACMEAARRRLRKLERGQYVFRYRGNRMAESLFSLGPQGRRIVEKDTGREIRLERRPPKQLEHFLGINDLRIAAEACSELAYFFACWELPGLRWRYPIVPDAVFSVKGRTYAAEFDRGQEGLRFFVRTKLATYADGLVGFPLAAVLIIAERETRMRSLLSCAPATRTPLLFTTIDRLREQGLRGAVFCNRAGVKVQVI